MGAGRFQRHHCIDYHSQLGQRAVGRTPNNNNTAQKPEYPEVTQNTAAPHSPPCLVTGRPHAPPYASQACFLFGIISSHLALFLPILLPPPLTSAFRLFARLQNPSAMGFAASQPLFGLP
ncbi:hypothetical protein BDV06DRAFT_85824 [Aspergillus oleicola]